MDIIPSYHLEKYEGLLNEITREHEKSLLFKNKIQQMDDTITFVKLSLLPCRKKISHMNVKIFSSISEIENLFGCDKINYCNVFHSNMGNSCFFVIEIFFTKSLVSKMTETKWKLHFDIQTDVFSVSKVVVLNTSQNSLVEVIRMDNFVYECQVNACLFYYFEGNWNFVDLCSVNVDVSYHFESVKEKLPNVSLPEFFCNITYLYNKKDTSDCIPTTILQEQVKSDVTLNTFVAELVKHSYHRLHLESFSDFLKDNRQIIDLQFSICDEKVIILYHKDSKIVKIKCSGQKLLMLKKIFIQLFKDNYEEIKKQFKQVKMKNLEDMDLDNLFWMHKHLKKLWL